MLNNKIHNRLSALEGRALQTNRKQVDQSIFIAALDDETDVEAIEKRIGIPECTHYQIFVTRKKDTSYEIKAYDKAHMFIGSSEFYHPKDIVTANKINKVDNDLMWMHCNQIVATAKNGGQWAMEGV